MEKNKVNIPESFKNFIENGRAVFRGDDGDWAVDIELIANTPHKKDVPSDALIYREEIATWNMTAFLGLELDFNEVRSSGYWSIPQHPN